MSDIDDATTSVTIRDASPHREGLILFAGPDLRVTGLNRPVRGYSTYRSRKFKHTLQLKSPVERLLAMALDLRADATGVRFNQLAIDAFDGSQWRSHVPTAAVCLRDEGWTIIDVQDDFHSSFLTYAMVEKAGEATNWPAATLEPHQIASPAVMALSREAAAHRSLAVSEEERRHVRLRVADGRAAGKGGTTLAALAAALGPTPGRGRAKVLALVAQGELDIRERVAA